MKVKRLVKADGDLAAARPLSPGGGPLAMTCRKLVEFLDDYVAGALPVRERAAFEEHLAACAECARFLDSYRKTIAAGKAAFADAGRAVPEELVAAILRLRRPGGGARGAGTP